MRQITHRWDHHPPCPGGCGNLADECGCARPNPLGSMRIVKPARVPTYGMCTGCGSVEVRLDSPTGTRDLSGDGEHHAYPTGYGCEVCS